MKLITEKSRLKGKVRIPGSKSHTIRAVGIASLADGKSVIYSPLVSSDTTSAVKCFRAMGAKIDTENDEKWVIEGTNGQITPPGEQIDIGNSGTTLRIATGSAALAEKTAKIYFTGDKQICSRPVAPLLEALNQLGANTKSVKGNGNPPVEVSGKLTGGKTEIEAVTSQYLSSLLLCCPLAENDTEINVSLLNEPGYVQMTLDWLDKQGIEYTNKDFRQFHIRGGQSYKSFREKIPSDFSSATFFLCAAVLAGDEVVLDGLDFNDSQPDKAVIDYLIKMGADIENTGDSVIVKASRLKGGDIDMNKTPDALPAMAVTAAFAEGSTKLFNVAQARNKETDRIDCMAKELEKMGIRTEQLPDGLIIHPGKIKNTILHGWSDHRIVMALSIAGLMTNSPLEIDTAEAMDVTFPTYPRLMGKLGAKIKTIKK